MYNRFLTLCGVILSLALFSCDNTTDEIGSSLTNNVDHLEVATSVFNVESRSVVVDSVVSRNSTGYLGHIKDPETGAYITGDFMTQFSCLEGYSLNNIDSIASRDESGEIIADSCEVRLFYTKYYGDSLATMKVTAYELDRPMTEDITYYSDFDPIERGYIRENGIQKSKIYSLVNTSELEEKKGKDYINNICVRLNDPYTDRNGVTYNNYGTYVLRQYYAHPEYFKNSISFAHHVVPGFFFKMTGGLGSMAYVTSPQLNIYYRLYIKNDSINNRLTLFSGTEEVLQTTKVTNDNTMIEALASDRSCTYIKGPAGIFTELTLPVDEIHAGHENDTINTAKIVLTRINNSLHSDYVLPAPQRLLMLEKDSLTSFFEKGKVANYKQSFLTSYSTSDNTYSFNNIGALISAMYASKEAGLRSDPDWLAKHPNWNKVLLVPVTATYTTYNYTTLLIDVSNDMSLTSARLVGGDTKLQMSVIYSKFQ
jgi:hypothetical protein